MLFQALRIQKFPSTSDVLCLSQCYPFRRHKAVRNSCADNNPITQSLSLGSPSMNNCQLQNLELLKPKCWCYYCKLKPSGLLWLFRASPSWYNAPSMSWVSHMSQVMTGSWSLWTWNPRYSLDQNCNSWSSHLFAHQCKCHVNPGTSLDRASVEVWFRLSKAISWSTTATKLNVINMDEASTAD